MAYTAPGKRVPMTAGSSDAVRMPGRMGAAKPEEVAGHVGGQKGGSGRHRRGAFT